MGNLNEIIRQLQEEEKQRDADQQAQTTLKQQQDALKLKNEELLRNSTKGHEDEKRLIFFEILNSLQIKQKLEEVKYQIWQGQGDIAEFMSDLRRAIRLSYDFPTKIPEFETKERYEYRPVQAASRDGGSYSSSELYLNEETKVRELHQVVKPSYLEVGVGINPWDSWLWGVPFLRILDTEVNLHDTDYRDSFWSLSQRIESAGGRLDSVNEREHYKDRSREIFNRKPRRGKSRAFFSSTGYGYSLDSSFNVNGIKLILTDSINKDLIKEFLDFGLAVSSAKRIAQNKLPLQLK